MALRYFNVYGPRMDVHGVYTEVLIRWMERIAAGQPPLILGDGTQTMDFVYVEDVARANVLAANSTATDEVFNVASGTETSLRELAEMLLKVMGAHARSSNTAPSARSTRCRAPGRSPRKARADCWASARIGSKRACAAGRVVAGVRAVNRQHGHAPT